MKMLDYSKIFRNFRKVHGLTQAQLAKQLECDQTRLAKIENLNRKPSADEILHILYLSGLDPYLTIEGMECIADTHPTARVSNE